MKRVIDGMLVLAVVRLTLWALGVESVDAMRVVALIAILVILAVASGARR